MGRQSRQQLDAISGVPRNHRFGEVVESFSLRDPQEILQHPLIDLLPGVGFSRRWCRVGKHLLEQGLRVPHAPLGFTREQQEGSVSDREMLLGGNFAQPLADLSNRDAAKVEALTAGKYRLRKAMRLGGGKNELDEGGWLLQGFQQRVKGIPSDLVHLIDDIDLEPASGGLIAGIFDELANLVDAAVRSPVDLVDVERSPAHDLLTLAAFAAGNGRRPVLAVERLGQDACGRGLTYPADSGK